MIVVGALVAAFLVLFVAAYLVLGALVERVPDGESPRLTDRPGTVL